MWTFAKALVTPIFWLLMVSGTLSLFTLRMVTVHQTAHLVDQGIPRLTAATILGSTGLVTAGALIVFGSLSDRIGRGPVVLHRQRAQCAALLVLMALPQTPPLWLLYLYVILWAWVKAAAAACSPPLPATPFPARRWASSWAPWAAFSAWARPSAVGWRAIFMMWAEATRLRSPWPWPARSSPPWPSPRPCVCNGGEASRKDPFDNNAPLTYNPG
ncbi:MAG: hypothetical protein R2838_19635 [Caldilineaceae bacterium]